MKKLDIPGNTLKREAANKWDGGKLRYDLLPVQALEEIVKVFTKGAEKYGDRNWEKGMSWSRLYAANQRHLNAYYKGEDLDPEWDIAHLAHGAWNTICLLHFLLTKTGIDDRPGQGSTGVK